MSSFDHFVVTQPNLKATVSMQERRPSHNGEGGGRETLFFDDGETRIDFILAYQVLDNCSLSLFRFLIKDM